MRNDLYIEFSGKQVDYKNLTDAVKEIWKAEGNKVKDLASVELYYKPEENACYYVLNGDLKGRFEV